VGDRVRLLLAGIRMKQIERVQAVQAILDVVESLRAGLFGFAEDERYTLVVHEARRRKLYPIARTAHPAIPKHGRVWSFGQGHVGEAARSNQLMISGDLSWGIGVTTDSSPLSFLERFVAHDVSAAAIVQ
jgi:hypothetical protein